MRAVYACAIVTAAIMVSASGSYAQDTKLSVPNVTVTAPAAPVEPPYMRAIPGSPPGEILISADIAWRRTNSPRCRARRRALLLVQMANACKATG